MVVSIKETTKGEKEEEKKRNGKITKSLTVSESKRHHGNLLV